MSTIALRNKVKKAVDALPDDKLLSVADFVRYVSGSNADLETLLKIARMHLGIAKADRDFAQGKGVNWRKVRRNV